MHTNMCVARPVMTNPLHVAQLLNAGLAPSLPLVLSKAELARLQVRGCVVCSSGRRRSPPSSSAHHADPAAEPLDNVLPPLVAWPGLACAARPGHAPLPA